MSQVFSKGFGKVSFFGIRVCVELDRIESLGWSWHDFWVVRVEFGWNSFFVEIRRLADVGSLGAGFLFGQIGRDKVAGEAARSVSCACPGTENEGCAFRHVVGVA